MFQRTLAAQIHRLAEGFPVLFVTGPRQAGKTTLVRSLFPSYAYANLENLDDRMAAEEDPVRFLLLAKISQSLAGRADWRHASG